MSYDESDDENEKDANTHREERVIKKGAREVSAKTKKKKQIIIMDFCFAY